MLIYDFLMIEHKEELIKYSNYIGISTESEINLLDLLSISNFLVEKLVVSLR
ncbi:hypothetical protein LBWT_27090 [Leptolyngbya boryana IAM M-101]|nr:hypothetical protein LBWT_27090 [Leptolyngbya boryana IAM M-101]BAS63133.1 hypothetical protein LBDG_27090 [Leptolyngbya boryana dg5]